MPWRNSSDLRRSSTVDTLLVYTSERWSSRAGVVVHSSVGLIAEGLGRPPFLAAEWAGSMRGAVRQDAYRVAAISERFSASPGRTTTMAIVPDHACITAIGVWFVKGFGVLTFLPPMICPLALLAESWSAVEDQRLTTMFARGCRAVSRRLCVPGLCSAEKLFPARRRDNFLAVTGINFLKLADQPFKSFPDSRKFIEARYQSGRLNTSDLLKDCRHVRRPYGSQKPSQVDAGVPNGSPLLFVAIRHGDSSPRQAFYSARVHSKSLFRILEHPPAARCNGRAGRLGRSNAEPSHGLFPLPERQVVIAGIYTVRRKASLAKKNGPWDCT